MIEQDINERMAGLAPSQNIGAESAVAAIMRDRGMTPTVEQPFEEPQFPQAGPPVQDPADAVVDRILERRRERLTSTMYGASKVNPDKAALAQKLAQETGIGSGIALRHLDELMVDSRMREIERKNYFESNPVLSEQLSDPEFAAVAQDDIGTLEKIGDFFKEWSMFQRTGYSPSIVKGVARGTLMVERGRIGTAAELGLATPQDIDRAEQMREDMGKLQGGGLFAATAEVVTQQIMSLKQTGTAAAGGAAIGSAIPGVGTAAGGALGFMAGTIMSTAQMEGGNAYLDMRRDGVSDDVAIPAAIAIGYLNGAIEVAFLKLAASPFKSLAKKAFKDATAEALAKPTVRSALAVAGKEYAKQVGGEATEESLQQFVSIITERIAKAAEGIEYEGTLKSDAGQILDSFAGGALASVLLGSVGPGSNLVYDLNRAEAAANTQRVLENLSSATKEGTLRPRSPVMFERYLQAQAERYDADTIYISAPVLRDVINQSGMTPEQLEQVLPGTAERIREALFTGGDVKIPTAQFAATVAGSKFGDALIPHMRLDPDAKSAAEASAILKNRESIRQEATQIIQQMEQTNEAFVQSARNVEDTFRRQVEGAGRPREEADVAAVLLRDFYVTMAAKRGITPEEAYAADAVTIAGEAGVAPALEPLEQANQFDQAGQRRTDTPEFKEWSRNAPIFEADEPGFTTGTPLVVKAYHGTNKTFVEFKMDRPAWFAARPGTAGQYVAGGRRKMGDKPGRGSQTIPVYLSFQNPLDLRYNIAGETTVSPQSRVSMADVLEAAGLPNDEQALRKIAELNLASGFAGVAADIEDKAGVLAAQYANKNKLWSILDDQGLIGTLKEAGFDGLILSEGGNIFAALNANDIKSVNNRGTWSRTTANIMEQAAVPASLDAVANVESAFAFAGTKAFKTNREFKQELQDRVLSAAKDAGIDLSQFTPEVEQYLVRVAVADAITALRTNPNAVGWYNEKVTKALRLVSLVHPEIATDPRAKFAFTWALAVTSNGLEVNKNFQLAERVYREYKQTGQMPTNVQAGQAQIAINASLGLFNDLVAKYGIDAVEQFMTTKTTVKEVMAYTNKNVSGENLTTEVYGAAALGPKIGNGFFANLYGHFEQLTMDRWLMRTWGRWTGTLLDDNRANIATKRKQLASMIKAMSANDKKAFEKILGSKLSVSKPDDVAVAIQKASVKPANRIEMARIGIADAAAQETFATILGEPARGIQRVSFGDELRKVGNALAKYLDGQKEAPSGPPERARIRRVMSQVLAELQTQFPSLTMSDLQALLWYPEKRLYDAAKTADEGKTGYDDNEAPDYANAAANLARTQGISDEVISDTIAQVDDELSAISVERAAGAERGIGNLGLRQDARIAGAGFEQAARGPARGTFDPRTLITTINRGGDLSTLIHESAHAFLTIYARIAERPDAPAQIKADIDALLKWFGIAGATPEARLAAWNGMTLEQQKKYHERFAYNFEIYAWEGKAPSAELRGLFNRFRTYLTRIYKSIRDDLNAIYRREFGEDLPILTNEVRQVMDRMLASEEQIRRYQAVQSMAPIFQTQEEAGMDDATWAAYVAMNQEAEDQAIADLTKASLAQVGWMKRAREAAERAEERGMAALRKEAEDEVRLQLVYRVQQYLRTGKFRDEAGKEVTVDGPHRLSIERIEAVYAGIPTEESIAAIRAKGMAVPSVVQPDWRKLGTGKSGMLAKEGLDPEMVAQTFGYDGADAMIRALVDAKPINEAIEQRTDELMQERYGEMDTPEAREQRISMAIHNEARARFIAVELRHIAKATQPVRVMLEAARIAAEDIISGRRIRDIRPQDHEAAEARAARDAANARRAGGNPAAAAQAAYTRAKNAVLEAPREDTPEALLAASEAAEVAGEAARAASMQQSAERINRFVQEYGNVEPDLMVIRAKRAQLYQNQLAAEARKAKEYVEKQVKYLRRVLRDENRKRMGAEYADQIEALLSNVNIVALTVEQRQRLADLAEWLKKMEENGNKPDISEDLAKAAFRVPYKDLTLEQFRELVEAVRTIEYMGKNQQKLLLEKQKADFKEKEAAINKRIEAVARSRGRDAKIRRSAQTRAGKAVEKIKGFFASGFKAWAIVEILDGGPDGPLYNFLIRTATERANMETDMTAKATERLAAILKPWYDAGSMMAGKVMFPSIGRAMTREARLAIALNVGNAGNIQRLLDGEGWTMEQIQPILESLTSKEWDAVQKIWDFMDEYRPLIAEKERRLFGKEPNWVEPQELTVRTADGQVKTLRGGYYPIVYDPVATFRSEKQSEVDEAQAQLKGAYSSATTRRTFTKERAAKVEDMPLLYSLQGLWSGVTDVIHDLAWHEWLIDANRLMRSEEFDRLVRSRYGDNPKLELRRWIEDNASGNRGVLTPGARASSFFRQNVSVAGLGYSIRGALMQLTGFSLAVTRVGYGPLVRAIGAMAINPLQTMRRVNSMSKFMEMRSRTQFRELNEIRNRVEGERGWQRGIRSHAYTMMLSMQRLVDIPTWIAGYENAISAGKDEDAAIALGDQAVIATQGSGLLKDLSRIEREPGLAKLFSVFYSYFNTVFNLAAVQTMNARSKGKAAHDLLMILVVPVMLEQLLKEILTPDGDDAEEKNLQKIAAKLTRAEVEYLLGMFMYAREMSGLAGLIEGEMRGYEGPAGLRVITTVQRAAQQAAQGEFDRGFRRASVDLLGAGLGLPSAQINRTIDGLEALSEGETENPLSAVMGIQRR